MQKICPKCSRTYESYPAKSRVDNKTEICPLCGTTEAIVTFGGRKPKIYTNKLTKQEKKFRKYLTDMVDGLMEDLEESSRKVAENSQKGAI